MNSSSYKLENKIPTVDVDLSLLKAIESYLTMNIPKLFGLQDTELKNNFTITIIEANGELEVNFLEQYDSDLFPDTTQRIKIWFTFNQKNPEISINIWIYFDKSSNLSYFKIEIVDFNPKEKAVGIATKLSSLINERKNFNFIFHPPFYIEITSVIVTAFSLPAIYYTHDTSPKLALGFAVPPLIIACNIFIFRKWKPFCSFSSSQQRRNDKVANYLLLGILSFILFTTGLMLTRRYFLGI